MTMIAPTEIQQDRIAAYRDLLRAIPGLEGLYDLAAALIASHASPGSRVLIAGAGGGREIAALADADLEITAVDPSGENLAIARWVAAREGVSDKITFLEGTVDELPSDRVFDGALSLLVMQHLCDDGAKLGYLDALGARLAPGGVLIHADLCDEGIAECRRLLPAYLAHTESLGIEADIVQAELDAMSHLPIISPARTCELLREAGFAAPQAVFQSLWYRCWAATRQEI